MYFLRYTYSEDSRIGALNNLDDQNRAVFEVSTDEKPTIEGAKETAKLFDSVERVEVLDEDDNVIYDSDS